LKITLPLKHHHLKCLIST